MTFTRTFFILIFLFAGATSFGQTPVPIKDTAFLHVLQQMGDGSKTLSIAGEFDSASVYAFMKKNDPLYGDRPIYKLALIHLLPRVKMSSQDNYFLHDSLLAITPNYLIENDAVALFDKLSSIALATNTDTAYAIVKLVSRDSDIFRSWLQFNYWQTFAQGAPDTAFATPQDIARWRNEGLSERRILQITPLQTGYIPHSKMLLPRMAFDADSLISDFVRPLYLWNQARINPNDQAIQQQVIAGFAAMSDLQSARGNAQRYAFMLYKQLLKNGQQAMADSLLDHVIAHLQRETNDSTNLYRRGAKSLQAYAWELKYEKVKNSDPKAAMDFLGKAAALAPKNAADKAGIVGNYDRDILQSKESYRTDYAEALIRSGDKKMAMRVMGDQLVSDPSFVIEFKAMFEKEFPDGNFAGFFNNVMKQTWKQAPDFNLTGLDGKQHRLSDYKGKWLVMDFWGTWCPPCREEMPKVNQFAISVANSPDFAFLSVACEDHEPAVRTFIQQAGYTMPVAMSDKKIQRDYAIKGYPAKVIVAPNGAMLLLEFGKDWQNIVTQFNAISNAPQKPKPVANGKTIVNNKQE